MKKLTTLIMVILLLSIVIPNFAKSRFGLRTDLGFGYIPMSDWVNWVEQLSEIHRHNPSFYTDIAIFYDFSERHSMVFEVGLVKTTSTISGVSYSIDSQLDTIGIWVYWSEHTLQTIPIGLAYEYNFPIKPDNFYLVMGVKGAYLLSDFHSKTHTFYEENYPFANYKYENDAKGYSYGGHFGLKSCLTDNLFMLSRLRLQYADGTASWGKDRATKIEFTGIDLNFGLGWYF